jgi:hypothetical protein
MGIRSHPRADAACCRLAAAEAPRSRRTAKQKGAPKKPLGAFDEEGGGGDDNEDDDDAESNAPVIREEANHCSRQSTASSRIETCTNSNKYRRPLVCTDAGGASVSEGDDGHI